VIIDYSVKMKTIALRLRFLHGKEVVRKDIAEPLADKKIKGNQDKGGHENIQQENLSGQGQISEKGRNIHGIIGGPVSSWSTKRQPAARNCRNGTKL